MEIRQIALVVNINAYPVLSSLQTSTFNRERLGQYLTEYGNFQVRFLPNPKKAEDQAPPVQIPVSQKELENAILSLFHPQRERIPQTALLYFTGHGLRKKKGIVEEFLAASDSNPAQGNWGINLQWLQKVFASSPIPQKMIWLDCFYGEELAFDFDECLPPSGGVSSFLATRRGVKLTEAGVDVHNDYFVQALLEGLNPFNHLENTITTTDLTNFVRDYLREHQQKLYYFNLGQAIALTHKPNVVKIPPVQSWSAKNFCPYPGLATFQVEDAPYFYGRTDLITQLLKEVHQTNFVALVGNSGTGKSSLLRAGLIAHLQSGHSLAGSENWSVRIFHPGDRPLMNLVWTLCDTNLAYGERARQLNQLQSLVQQGANGFQKFLELYYPNRLVLIIDQFEELFTLCQNSLEKQTFLDCLLGVLDSIEKNNYLGNSKNSNFVLVIAMRSDFLENCLELADHRLADRLQNHLVTITPMAEKALTEVIIKPAKQADLALNSELVAEILRDLDYSSSSLPLLQYTLRKLWRQEDNQGLQIPAYRLLGGIKNALDKQATAAYHAFSELEQETVQYIFLALVEQTTGRKPIARGVINRELVTPRYSIALIDLVVQKLVYEQLVFTEPVPLSSGELEQPFFIHLSHVALIQHWKLLQQWLKERQDYLQKKQKIEDTAKQWQNSTLENQKSYLLSGKALTEVKKFQEEQGDHFPLSQVAEVFIQASSQTQRIDRVKMTVLIGIVPLIGLIFLGWQIYRYSQTQGNWKVISDNQGKRESLPRIQALESLNKAGVALNQKQFNGLNLQKINLANANLSNSNFTESFLTDANLVNANLTEADLSQIELTGADLSGANLSNSKLIGGYLTGANLAKSNLTNADLTNTNLIRASLTGATLQGANFLNAELTGAKLTGVDLSRAKLNNANLWGVDLTGANLTETNLNQANLTRVNFAGASLTKATLREANLTTADFSSAKNIPLEQIKSACFWDKAIFTEEIEQKLANTAAAKYPSCQKWR
ncbi:MAG: pentapeptide repeat-containing protein [Snowella sp.]